MPRILWGTDFHFPTLGTNRRDAIVAECVALAPDLVLIGGDTAESDTVVEHLRAFITGLDCPVGAVLGNHDFYGASVRSVRFAVGGLHVGYPSFTYLARGPLRLSPRTAVVGTDGWGDGGYGRGPESRMRLPDERLIDDLAYPGDAGPWPVRRGLAAADAAGLQRDLASVLSDPGVTTVVVLTHVPPFPEASWHMGARSDADALAYYACRAVGDVLRARARSHPDVQFLVLAGHTHSAADVRLEPNLRVVTPRVDIRSPGMQPVIDVP